MGDTGFETFECHGENRSQEKTNVNSDVISLDSDFNRLVELWGVLDVDYRRKVVELAEELAG